MCFEDVVERVSVATRTSVKPASSRTRCNRLGPGLRAQRVPPRQGERAGALHVLLALRS